MNMNKRAAAPVIALAAIGLAACSTSRPTASIASTPAVQATHTASAEPSPTGLSTVQIDALVRTLYYGESQAYQDSAKDGFAYTLAHDYPGSVDGQKFLACAASFEAKYPGAVYTTTPEIDTLAPDPAWVGPSGMGADWTFAGKKPMGQTFILTVDETLSGPSAQPSTTKNQVHVTISNGTAYYYETAC
jgi:hypothetical protein